MAGKDMYMSGPWIFSEISKWLCLLLKYCWEIKTEGSEMRYLYFACISSYLLLFFCNHAHARIGETYEQSVKRYEKAGFTKERTTVQVPPDDPELGFFEIDKKPVKRFDKGMKEITWTKKNPRGGKPVEVVSIRQLFYYEWPRTNQPKPWKTVFRCVDITYQFKDPIPDPMQNIFMRNFVAVVLGQNEDDRYGDRRNTWSFGFDVYRTFRNQAEKIAVGMFHDGGKHLNIIELFRTSANKFRRTREEVWKQLKAGLDRLKIAEERKLLEEKKEAQAAERKRKFLQTEGPELIKEIEESGL